MGTATLGVIEPELEDWVETDVEVGVVTAVVVVAVMVLRILAPVDFLPTILAFGEELLILLPLIGVGEGVTQGLVPEL